METDPHEPGTDQNAGSDSPTSGRDSAFVDSNPAVPAWGPPVLPADPVDVPTRGSKRPARVRIAVAVVVVVSLVGGAAYALISSGSHRSPAVIVADALRATMSRKTAAVTFSETDTAAGVTTKVAGSGSIDFAQSSLDLVVYIPVKSQSLQLEVIYTADGYFESGPGITDHSIPGKSWVSVSLKDVLSSDPQAAGLFVSANPAALLPYYGNRDDVVKLVGPRPKTRSAARTYAVTVPASSYQRELALLPQSAQNGLKNVSYKQLPTDLSIDSSGMVREARMRFDFGSALQVDETLDFSQYGASLSVTPPAPDATMTVQQFVAASSGESSAALQGELLTPSDIGTATTAVQPPAPVSGDCFDPRPLLGASRAAQSGEASELLEQPLKDGGHFDMFEQIAAYQPQYESQVFSQIVGQLDACTHEQGYIKGTDVSIPMAISELPLSSDTDTRLAPFDFDASKAYQKVATYPDGSHGYIDLTVFVQGEKIAIVSFGQLGATDAPFFLSLADTASQRMTP